MQNSVEILLPWGTVVGLDPDETAVGGSDVIPHLPVLRSFFSLVFHVRTTW